MMAVCNEDNKSNKLIMSFPIAIIISEKKAIEN